MITTKTYRTHTTDIAADLLAAYSALDHNTTAGLRPEEVDAAFRILLTRLSTLLFLHGADVPARFLSNLADPGDLAPTDITAAWLESGAAPGCHTLTSELQQEVVHFSRILDVGTLGLDDGSAAHAVRRLRGSLAVPNSLKVLSELLIVTRSRLLQRGLVRPTPRLRPNKPATQELDAATTAWVPEERDFILVLESPRRRARRNFGFLFTALMNYLTPAEAAVALWSHALSTEFETPMSLHLTVMGSDSALEHVSWNVPAKPTSDGGGPPAKWCESALPQMERSGRSASARLDTPHGARIGVEPTTHHPTCDVTTCTGARFSFDLKPLPEADPNQIPIMLEKAHRLLSTYVGPEVRSIECGHIHLDRQIDIDQKVGALLGAKAMGGLSRQDRRSPVLTPMMDDDHVLTKLRPHQYRSFLESHFPGDRMHLIPESSPIIRGIVCCLWERLHLLDLQGRCRKRGDNILFQLAGSTYIELFENISTEAVNGCIFFELGLLIYRLAPDSFDDYFRERYDLPDGVHQQASAILDGPEDHDARVARLQDFYRTFDAVTSPRHVDSGISELVEEVLEQAYPCAAQLNVLEDYYESQQAKVRQFIKLMQLPINLLTIHFNAQTGRITLHTDHGVDRDV